MGAAIGRFRKLDLKADEYIRYSVPGRFERTFDYFSGSLEHSRSRREEELELECGGIVEHACDILDGGEEAFRKRRRKYKIF